MRSTFLERREVGVLNVGGPGSVQVDGVTFPLDKLVCLYIGPGANQVNCLSADAELPAAFYLLSYPAHKTIPPPWSGSPIWKASNSAPPRPATNAPSTKQSTATVAGERGGGGGRAITCKGSAEAPRGGPPSGGYLAGRSAAYRVWSGVHELSNRLDRGEQMGMGGSVQAAGAKAIQDARSAQESASAEALRVAWAARKTGDLVAGILARVNAEYPSRMVSR